MANRVIPTKANLLNLKDQVAFAQKGYELLDKKRTVLIQEMMRLNAKARKLQGEIHSMIEQSYGSLIDATIVMGSENVEGLSQSMALEKDFDLKSRSVMGVEVPKINYHKEPLKTEYSFHQSTAAFDQASLDFNKLLYYIYELAEVETSVFRIAQEIKQTAKRANALDKIQIPKFTANIKMIEDVLAEKEREDFFRLKKVKKKREDK